MGKQHIVEYRQISTIKVTSTESTSTYRKGFSNLRDITSKMKEIRENLGNEDYYNPLITQIYYECQY